MISFCYRVLIRSVKQYYSLPFFKGIKVIVIGIGSDVDPSQLRKMVQDPNDLFQAPMADSLLESPFIVRIAKISCDFAGMGK